MATTTMNSSVLEAVTTRGRSLEAIRTFFEIAGAAIRCANAVESGYRPNLRDLRTLGISEQIGHAQQIGR